MTHMIAENRSVNNAKPANRQASKTLTYGSPLREVRESSFVVKKDQITHKVLVSGRDFLF